MLSSTAGAAAAGSSIPTTTVLKVSPASIQTSQIFELTATVENSVRNIPINVGKVKFVVESAKPFVLGQVKLNKNGEAVLGTDKLTKTGPYLIEAKFTPNGQRFAQSLANPVQVTVSPLTAVSFLVRPDRRYGRLNKPLSFTVTALNAQHRPDTSYTGTVTFSSPTDSWTTFPKAVYVSLSLSAPSPQTTGLAGFAVKHYTFTTADQGTHHFLGGVVFGKAGAEVLRVAQSNNGQVQGKTTFAVY